MKSLFLKIVAAVFAVAIISVSCKKESTPTDPTPEDPYADLYKVGESAITGTGLTVTLYMDEEPFMGYNYVYAVVKDDVTGDFVENANVTFKPMMDMGSMMHSAPLEQPIWNADWNAYKGTVTFIMPSAGGTWTVTVNATNPVTLDQGEAVINVNVITNVEPRLFSFISAVDNAKIFVALTDPREPVVGMNDFGLVIYSKQDMYTFPPVSDLKIEIEPEMPTMGHGSPNNVNPTAEDFGHYMGQVNFTMTGYWKVNLTIKDAQDQLMWDQGYFDITFQ